MTEPDEPTPEPDEPVVPLPENTYQVAFEASGEVGEGTAPETEDEE